MTFSFFKYKTLKALLFECDEMSVIFDTYIYIHIYIFTDWPKSQKSIRNLLKHMQSKVIGMDVTESSLIFLYVTGDKLHPRHVLTVHLGPCPGPNSSPPHQNVDP